MLVFAEGGNPENPEKNSRSREENQHKLNPLMASGPRIEPRPHWWEASALTTAPSLLNGREPVVYHVPKTIGARGSLETAKLLGVDEMSHIF